MVTEHGAPAAEQLVATEHDSNAVIPSRYTLLDDFLAPDEHRGLLDYAVVQETEFVASQVTSK